MPIGPGHDDPEYDNYDPAWRDQDTPFRQWIAQRLGPDLPAEAAALYAPVNRYHGLSHTTADTIATITGTTVSDVMAAHRADLDAWAVEQELRSHPGLAVVDADLDRIRHRS
ncbi:hypothetical protein ACIQIG_33130 [Streptomyces bacillaris]|uniref:hypothetical protein n=1 Tax=Streptomyces bacillaris TaxID=68179 RepID=UPI00345F173E